MKFSRLGKYMRINSSVRKAFRWKSMDLPMQEFKPRVELGKRVTLSPEYLKDLGGSGRFQR